jgi:hypothetical protein
VNCRLVIHAINERTDALTVPKIPDGNTASLQIETASGAAKEDSRDENPITSFRSPKIMV